MRYIDTVGLAIWLRSVKLMMAEVSESRDEEMAEEGEVSSDDEETDSFLPGFPTLEDFSKVQHGTGGGRYNLKQIANYLTDLLQLVYNY